MTDELQADPVVDTAPLVEGSDLATDTGGTPEEKITFSDEQQKVFDDAIGKKTFNLRQQQREFGEKETALQSQIAKLQSQIPEQTRPVVPPVPDSYADDFDQQMAARDDVISQAAEFDGAEKFRQEQQQQAAVKVQNDEVEAINKQALAYSQNATTLGIKPEELQKSGAILQQMGVTGELATQLLNEETGPLMSNYLAANPDVFDQLNRADQWSKGVILNDVRLKADEMKPQQTSAPAPADVLTGGGSTTVQRGPKGATYA